MVISTMIVRGAGAIGATAGYAMAQAFLEGGQNHAYIKSARQEIKNTRPTAQNLFYAVERVYRAGLLSTGHFSAEHAVKKLFKLLMKMPRPVKKSVSWAMN